MGEEELQKIFKQKREKRDIKKNGKIVISPGFVNTTFQQFKQWFNQETFDKGCHYCKTTNATSNHLYNIQRTGGRHDATRGGKRGKRLELDRKNPQLPYDVLSNVVWCCYWCNNAKTNFFTETEFETIGKAIGDILTKINIEHSINTKRR
jgi:hypothetical protein